MLACQPSRCLGPVCVRCCSCSGLEALLQRVWLDGGASAKTRLFLHPLLQVCTRGAPAVPAVRASSPASVTLPHASITPLLARTPICQWHAPCGPLTRDARPTVLRVQAAPSAVPEAVLFASTLRGARGTGPAALTGDACLCTVHVRMLWCPHGRRAGGLRCGRDVMSSCKRPIFRSPFVPPTKAVLRVYGRRPDASNGARNEYFFIHDYIV